MYLPLGFQERHKASVWSSTDKDASFTVSNGGLTITGGGGGSGSFVAARATCFLRPGDKYYVEFTCLANPGNLGVGFLDLDAALNNFPGSGTNGVTAYTGNRGWSYGGGGVATWVAATPVVNDVICLAMDGVNGVIYGRVNGGQWNASGTANPATNTGGFACTNVFNAKFAIAFTSNNTTASVLLNAGSSSFAQTPPAGFRGPNATAQTGS